MPLSQAQQATLKSLPQAQRAEVRRRMLLRNSKRNINNSPNPSPRKPRTNINRRNTPRVIRPTNTISNNRRYTNQTNFSQTSRAPTALGTSVERVNTNTIKFARSVYVKAFSAEGQDELAFTTHTFMINPNNLEWIRDQAKFFSRYKFLYFKYRFVSSCATNVNGFHWTAVTTTSSINDLKQPKTFMSAQSSQQFHAGPVWKTDTQFHQFPRSILAERWFSTSDHNKSAAEVIPGWIYFGTDGTTPGTGVVGQLEVAYSIVFESPTDPLLHLNHTPHQQNMEQQFQLIRAYHSGISAHDKAIIMRVNAMESEELNSEIDSVHRDAILDLLEDLHKHCKAAGHEHDVKPYYDRIRDEHPKIESEDPDQVLEDKILRLMAKLGLSELDADLSDSVSLIDAQ